MVRHRVRTAVVLAGMVLAGAAQARDTLASAHESNGPAIGGTKRVTAADARLRIEHDAVPADLSVVAAAQSWSSRTQRSEDPGSQAE